MLLIAILAVGLAVAIVLLVRMKRMRVTRELEEHSIEAEALYNLLASDQEVLIFDVRQPLDLLAHSEIIPGSTRIPPKDVTENAMLIPKEKDTVVYCTCPSEKTSRVVLRRAQGLHFSRIKFLHGGLEAWKAKGYPVETYDKPFNLND
jgi:rhodanese-related sulfurtransferase